MARPDQIKSSKVTGERGYGIGRENIDPSGKMGLGHPPLPESKPFRLRMIRIGWDLNQG
jgi:hypothetical protein